MSSAPATPRPAVQPYDFVLGRHPTKIICDGKGPPRLDLEPSPGMIIDCRGDRPVIVQQPEAEPEAQAPPDPPPEPEAEQPAAEQPAVEEPEAEQPAQPRPMKKKVAKKRRP